jgi:hypothetical protein
MTTQLERVKTVCAFDHVATVTGLEGEMMTSSEVPNVMAEGIVPLLAFGRS